jgi:4-aminobutyrate aminotransferase
MSVAVRQSHVAGVWSRATDLDVVSGSGSYVTTSDGDRFLDFTSGIGVVSTGHCHPRVVQAISDQAARFVHAQVNLYRHPLLEELATRLAASTPAGIDTFFFANSGAEAVEAAVKLCRWATGRPNLIVFNGGFHGRTGQTMAMSSSKILFRGGHGPLPSGVFFAPYPPAGASEEAGARALRGLRDMLETQTAPYETAAIFVEPILGEGGYVVPPPGFLSGVAEIAREHGLLLVVDEIQSGCGRTGRFLAVDHFGVEPDVVVLGKGLASGFPIAGIGARHELTTRWPAGSHGGTYGGNPMGCAAALATLDVIESEGLLENAAVQGEYLASGLGALRRNSRLVGDVRGIGLMLALEIVDADGEPSGEMAERVRTYAREDGRLLLVSCGPRNNVIRVIPPLNVTRRECDAAIDALTAAVARSEQTATAAGGQ